jgi:N-acetylneuraminate synthase
MYDYRIAINNRIIDRNNPTYFIADIAANHDGDLERAKDLIILAKEAGAEAVKFQHFLAEKIVSDYGFKHLGAQLAHHASWSKSVFDVYRDCECPRNWTEELVKIAAEQKVDFLTTPYDLEALEELDRYLPAYKIGSGDITWLEFIEQVAMRGKPVFLATGASTMEEVERAVAAVVKHNPSIVLMQCNTEYSGSRGNFRYVNLKVLQAYALRYPNMVLGLSDHTPGAAVVLGGVALGASVVEKHFTDDNGRKGPDHIFSMTPKSWREMVLSTRELEDALGGGVKKVENNERNTVVLQRRALRAAEDLPAGTVLKPEHLESLRPAPPASIAPWQVDLLLGKTLRVCKASGDALRFEDLE